MIFGHGLSSSRLSSSKVFVAARSIRGARKPEDWGQSSNPLAFPLLLSRSHYSQCLDKLENFRTRKKKNSFYHDPIISFRSWLNKDNWQQAGQSFHFFQSCFQNADPFHNLVHWAFMPAIPSAKRALGRGYAQKILNEIMLLSRVTWIKQ